MEKEIKITAEPQMDPNKCKFILEKPIVEGGSFFFKNKSEASSSAIAEEILKIENIIEIVVSANTITVTKGGGEDWRTIGPKIGIAIRSALTSGKPLISEEAKKNLPKSEDIKKSVKKILDSQVNPAIASHGGYIELLDVRNNDIFIRMSGGCQGCGMAAATLKQGVEEAIRKEMPNIGTIYDTTDHASGQNPYYQPR